MTSNQDSPNDVTLKGGWLEDHPEDQVLINFQTLGMYDVPLFKELSFEEEQEYRQHARDNYVAGTEINELFHPVWQDEARIIDRENGYA